MLKVIARLLGNDNKPVSSTNPLTVADAPNGVLIGAVNETAPATDTASSGLNGRLQRIAQALASFTSGYSIGKILSAATTNATSVKASAGKLYGVNVGNGSTVAFLKLYNKASAPTVGTDTPVATFQIPANGVTNISFPGGLAFSTGIAWALTGFASDSDTTAVGNAQITGALAYI